MWHNHQLMLKGWTVTQMIKYDDRTGMQVTCQPLCLLGLQQAWAHVTSLCQQNANEVWTSSVEMVLERQCLFHYSFPMIENVWSFSQPTGIAEIFPFQLPNTKLGNFFILVFFSKKNNPTGNMHNLWTDKWLKKNVKELVNTLCLTVIGNWELMEEVKNFLLLDII